MKSIKCFNYLICLVAVLVTTSPAQTNPGSDQIGQQRSELHPVLAAFADTAKASQTGSEPSKQVIEAEFGPVTHLGHPASVLLEHPAPQGPMLQIKIVGNLVKLYWPASPSGYILWSRSDLSPNGAWAPAEIPTVVKSGYFEATTTLQTSAAFFRLQHQ